MKNTISIANEETNEIKASQLEVGEMGVVIGEDHYRGSIVLHTCDNFVLLNEPNSTWSNGERFTVRRLLPGTVLTITLGTDEPTMEETFATPSTTKPKEDILSWHGRNVVSGYISRGNKIGAIRHVRMVTGIGLKEAKDYVDNFHDDKITPDF